jgi:hypothetical protein
MDKHYDKLIVTEPVGAPVPVITLRDYLAAAALTGLLAGEPDADCGPDGYAKDAYLFADAMLLHRGER